MSKTPGKKTRVYLVDDHMIVRQGVKMLMSNENDMEVCGEADNAPDALHEMTQLRPDVAVVDLSLKDSSGLELIKDLTIQLPRMPVLVLSMHDESFYAERVLRAGAKGYITKEEGMEKVVEAIRRLVAGEVFLSDSMSSRMLTKIVSGQTRGNGQTSTAVDRLSDRELEIFQLIGTGLSTQEIAERLHLSAKTIESHRQNIKEKLALDSGKDLLKVAIQWMQSNQI